MPEGSVPPRTASALVRDELLLDGNSRQNLALKMDPIVLAGAVTGALNRATAMRAISECVHSTVPAFGSPVSSALRLPM